VSLGASELVKRLTWSCYRAIQRVGREGGREGGRDAVCVDGLG